MVVFSLTVTFKKSENIISISDPKNCNNYNLYDHVASLVLNAAYNELSVAYNVLRSLRS